MNVDGSICRDVSGVVRFESDAPRVEEKREPKAVIKVSNLMLPRPLFRLGFL